MTPPFGQVIYGATYGYATHFPFRFGQIIFGAIRLERSQHFEVFSVALGG